MIRERIVAVWTAFWASLRRLSAPGLNLAPDAPLAQWLLRAFFRPPREGQRDVPARAFARLGKDIGQRLNMGRDRSVGAWLLRIFLRPRRARQRLAADLRKLHKAPQRHHRFALRAWLDRRLEPVYRAMRARAAVGARLPGVPWEGVEQQLEKLSAALDSVPFLRQCLLWLAFVAAIAVCTTPLPFAGQVLLFLLVYVVVMIARRLPGRLATMLMVMLSILMTGRYVWWRSTQTLHLSSPAEAVVGYILYAAELYTWIVLIFGYVQTAWPLRRKPQPLPDDPADWPTVDLYIPTYNEPLSVVRPTVFAASSIDWPRDKLRVYILDDGTRDEFRRFAEEAGVGYIVRTEHTHAKAGNINHAMPLTQGEYIAIFDCDHIPTRSFLQTTVGVFLADKKCAMVQTPHHFFSPDPFERNFDTFHRVPNEGSLFYGLIQDGNDFWDATFFCGSCAVIKRSALEHIGGIATETVTEDAHTSLRLHRHGYTSAYLRTVQAAGLATDSLADHIGQRIRWARGMTQIFRVDNPWIGKGLSFFQRMCYSNAMLHFFYGFPRLIFLVMPGAYLYFGLHVINTPAPVILAYVVPYLVIAAIANSRIQGRYRHSFWAEAYESVLAWYIVLPTTMALINPKLGKFNVTSKGGHIEHEYLDWTISKPYLVLLAINVCSVLAGIGRLTIWRSEEPATVFMNLFWAGVNLTILGLALGVAKEAKQVRVAHRIPLRVPAMLTLPDGRTLACKTENYSMGGLGLMLPADAVAKLEPGERINVTLARGVLEHDFPAVVARLADRRLGVRFTSMTMETERKLVECTFGRADAWLEWEDVPPSDAPLHGLMQLIELSWQGYLRLIDAFFDALETFFTRRRAGQVRQP
ncbi:UDP-forming cellulose synthase catalytic subunit [Paraburkholderia silvatlantica]|uniref:Cellulose synthase catalytic subunit [UDP-forming] n=1 Tax=Paraburkholderia silvatlantica TaxID=321895 RepID=A0A2V4SX81_9BURK|nr:UDP-forming cellulose synthase catalytic subunit [Paraburkholderia silvatlantica]PYE12703.1 cellulose synthase (UDP-forming) [Paraburkholderia silvatlantica]TDQ73601.1 cellulose synthase (UDP-forming) [Paraburkholderia silvatlantica]